MIANQYKQNEVYYLLHNGKCPVCKKQIRKIIKKKKERKIYTVRVFIEEEGDKAVKCGWCKNLINFR